MLRSAFQVVTHEHTSTLVYVLSLFGHLLFSFLNASLYQASTCRIMWDKGQDDCADRCWGWQSAPRELWSVTWMLQKGGRDPYQFHMQEPREPSHLLWETVCSCSQRKHLCWRGVIHASFSAVFDGGICFVPSQALSSGLRTQTAATLRESQQGSQSKPLRPEAQDWQQAAFSTSWAVSFLTDFFLSLMLGLHYKSHLLYWMFLGEWVCKVWGKQEKGDLLLI